MVKPKIHTLANGSTIIFTSPGHGAKFADGTVCEPQHKEVCEKLTCQRIFEGKGEILGMKLTSMRMILSDESLEYLYELAQMADIVLVPFPVLTALREQSVRNKFFNVVCPIATKETERSALADKVWDCTKWSW